MIAATATPREVRQLLKKGSKTKGLADEPRQPPKSATPADPEATFNRQRAEEFASEHGTYSNGNTKRNKNRPEINREDLADPVIMLPLRLIERHPDNGPANDPRLTHVDELAKSIAEAGLQEPVIVRLLDTGRYQLLSGERRTNAARLLGWVQIPARVRELTDAQALAYLAFCNGQRQDLDPINRARLGRRLMQPEAEGGAGLNRDTAARQVGLTSGPALSNLVGLLELPIDWQHRVASGALSPSWAEKLRRVAHVAPVMQALERDWMDKTTETFESRERLEDAINWAIRLELRAVTPALKLDKLPPETREALGLVEIATAGEGRGKQHAGQYATNHELADKLAAGKKAAAIVERASAAGKAAENSGAGPAPLTKKELQRKAAVAADRLEANIRAWRHEWLCELIAATFEDQDWRATKFLVWMLTQFGSWGFGIPEHLRELLAGLAEKKSRHAANWALVDSAKLYAFTPPTMRQHTTYQRSFQLDALLRDLCRAVLTTPDKDARFPRVPYEVSDGLARDCAIDLAAEWKRLQAAPRDSAPWARFAAFWELHQAAQLDKAADQVGVYVADASGKAAKIKLLTAGRPQPLPLPASIEPVAKPAKAKGGKK